MGSLFIGTHRSAVFVCCSFWSPSVKVLLPFFKNENALRNRGTALSVVD